MNPILKTAGALAVVATVAVATATPSDARSGRWAAAGAGFAAGALVGAAAANAWGPNYYYGPGYGYGYAYAPGYAYRTAPAYDAYAYSGPTYTVAPRTYYRGGYQTQGCVTDDGYGRLDYSQC